MNQQNSIQKQTLTAGNQYGPSPVTGNDVYVHYTGKFADGRVFDSSVSRGSPFNFKLNAGQVIQGWDMAVSGMKQGEKSIFLIPSELAYGQRGAGSSIPPNTDLYFEIELLGWN